MSFGAPALLVLLALAPLVAAGLTAIRRWQTDAATRYAGRRPPAALVPLASSPRWVLGAALITVAVTLIALAAARPQVGSQQTQVERTGIDLMLVLDVSRSMNGPDVAPSRLGRAQEEILSLFDGLPGDRVGLVIFARGAVLRSPLSTDLRAVGQLVRSASLDQQLLQPGTALAAAIDAATDALVESPAAAIGGPPSDRSRVMLIISDGEDHEGRAVEAALRATQQGIRIYTAGVGSREGVLIPEVGSGGDTGVFIPKEEPASGQAVVSRLNEALLRRLADLGNGRYVALAGNDRPLASLTDDFANLENTLLATSHERRPIERFQWFVLAALVALAVQGVVAVRWRPSSEGRLRWAPGLPLASLALLGLIGAACAPSAHSLNDKGNRLYAEGSYAEALDAYQRAQAERPDLGQLNHNAANALHRLGRFERAAKEARRALITAEGPLAGRLYYGLGNHLVRAGRLEEALDAYTHALIENPSDGDAKYNLEVVLRLLQERPPPPEATGDAQGSEPADQAQPGQGESGQPIDGERTPGLDQPGGESEVDRAAQIQQDLQRALAGIEQEFTIEEALRVLDLLRERQLLQPLTGEPVPVVGPDY